MSPPPHTHNRFFYISLVCILPPDGRKGELSITFHIASHGVPVILYISLPLSLFFFFTILLSGRFLEASQSTEVNFFYVEECLKHTILFLTLHQPGLDFHRPVGRAFVSIPYMYVCISTERESSVHC